MLNLKIYLVLVFMFVGYCSAQTTPQSYYLLEPSRDGKKEQVVQIAKNRGTELFLMASCKSCMPATYAYNKEASKILGKKVYGTSGIYVLPYDENSYVLVFPKKPLGEGIWEGFGYSNFISADKLKVNKVTKNKIEEWATDLSKKVMSGAIGESIDLTATNEYYPGAKIGFNGGKKENKVTITYTKKKLTIGSLLANGEDSYYYMPKMSKALGIEIYGDNSNLNEYVIIENSLAVIWLKFSAGSDFGKSEWGEYDKVNYFHKNQKVIRKLLVNEASVKQLMSKISAWCKEAIIFKDKEYKNKENNTIKNRRLPEQGLKNIALEKQALLAAKNWAKRYRWKETITKVYFNSEDWNIYRNKLTGAQLGRRISGIIVMKRPDGKCSFHYASFAQQYNGSGYQKVFTEGITPGQNIIKCEYAR